MGNDKKDFWLDLAILIDLIIVILSCTMLHINESECTILGLRRSIWLWIHVGAGLILLTCLIFHIARHWWWFRAAFCCTGKAKSNKVLLNRTIIIGLLIVFALIILSGASIYTQSANLVTGNPLPNTSEIQDSYHRWKRFNRLHSHSHGQPSELRDSYHRWKQLHESSAVFMFVLVVGHLTGHRNWLASATRRYVWPKR